MAQVINTNALSLMAQNNLNKSQSTLGTAIQRLSSGLRINSAKDDAAGQAISNRFTANITGLSQASRNANDGISIAQTTEGALNEVNDNLQNIRRLTVQAENGTNSDSDRQSIQDEINQRLEEIDRISDQTEFNGVKVLKEDQELDIQVGANDDQTIKIKLSQMNSEQLGLTGFSIINGVKQGDLTDATKVDVDAGYKYDKTKVVDSNSGGSATVDDIVTDENGVAYVKSGSDYFKITPDFGDPNDVKLNIDSSAAPDIPTGATTSVDGHEAMKKGDPIGVDPNDTLKTDGKGNYYLLHQDNTLTKADVDQSTGNVTDTGTKVYEGDPTDNPLKTLDAALSKVDGLRSGLGAVQNRFASVINNLNSTVNNLSESRSRILDADFASEVSEMSRSNILQSAGTTVLAQANQVPQNVLTLLR